MISEQINRREKLIHRKPAIDAAFKIAACLLFLFACGIIQYFIWSDLFIQEFDADVAENVIWAQASVESGKLINPDFYYNQMLPFGGNMIFIPIVQHYGVSLFSLRLGMSIWSGLFALVLAGFFFSLEWNFSVSMFSAAVILMFLSGTEKLREIFWTHVVHYNLSLFYLLLALIFLSGMFRKKRKQRIFSLIGFELCLIFGSANDIAVVLFFSVCILCGIILERFLCEGLPGLFAKHNLILISEIILGILLGFLLGRILTSDSSTAYIDNFSVFSSADQWMSNLMEFPNNWFSMFTNLPDDTVPFFSSVGIKLLIRIFAALLIFSLSFRSLAIWRFIGSRSERIFICCHWFICAAILFFYIFGIISAMSWRIIPMFFTSLVVSLIILKHDISHFSETLPGIQLLDIGAVSSILLYAGICSFTVFHQSINTDIWFGQGGVLKTLADYGLTYGYNLDYWFANSITVLTDERIKVREVILKDGKLSPSYHQSNIHWYDDQPDTDRYFLVCQEDEFWYHPEFADGAVATYRATQERTFIKGSAGFFIFVYDKNIFQDGEWVSPG